MLNPFVYKNENLKKTLDGNFRGQNLSHVHPLKSGESPDPQPLKPETKSAVENDEDEKSEKKSKSKKKSKKSRKSRKSKKSKSKKSKSKKSKKSKSKKSKKSKKSNKNDDCGPEGCGDEKSECGPGQSSAKNLSFI